MNILKKLVVMILLICIYLVNADIAYAEGTVSDTKDSFVYQGVVAKKQEVEHSERWENHYLDTLKVEKGYHAKVKVEFDSDNALEDAGGMIQVALTKDEAHCYLMDNILLKEGSTGAEESVILYPGEYTVEVHLLTQNPAVVPFKITVNLLDSDNIPVIDKEATIWFNSDSYYCDLKEPSEENVYDIYSVVSKSSWYEITPMDLVYESSDSDVAVIDKKGCLEIRKTGVTDITVTHPNKEKAITTVYVRR